MLPKFSIYDVRNLAITYSKFLCNIYLSKFSSCIQSSYFYNILCFKFNVGAKLSNRMPLPPLGNHVSHICQIVADKKVKWVHAVSDIAAMANFLFWNYLESKYYPRKPMCEGNYLSKVYYSVASFSFCSRPQLASFGLLNSFKESLQMASFNLDLPIRCDVRYLRFIHGVIMFGFSGFAVLTTPPNRVQFNISFSSTQAR